MKIHPHYKFLGIQDNSIPAIEPTIDLVPQHVPWFYGIAAWGPTRMTYNDGATFTRRYHEQTLLARSKYENFITPFISGALSSPNPIFFKRLEMPGMQQAGITLALDVLETEVPLYEVDDQGHYILDNGDRIATGSTAPGLLIIPIVTNLDFSAIGDGTRVQGTQTAGDGTTSNIFKIADIPAKWAGSLGNGIGIRPHAPTTVDVAGIDTELMDDQDAYVYRLEIVLKENDRTSPNPWKTFYGARAIDFTLKPGSYNPNTNEDLYLPDRYDAQYVNEEYDVEGPFEALHVYQENIDLLLEKMQTVEAPINSRVDADPSKMYRMNIFRDNDHNGVPYRTITMADSLNNYPEFTSINTHYLVDGNDGDMSRANIEAAIENELLNFGELEDKVKDIARFPFSSFYDVGYGMNVKRAMGNVLAARSDLDIVSSPFIAGGGKLPVASEVSAALALRSHYRLIPESTVYGTPTCRATIMGQSARPLNVTWTQEVPSTYELLLKRCKYLGAADGYPKAEYQYNRHPRNKIEYLRNSDITDTWAEESVRNVQWNTGLVNIHSSGLKENFIPAFQTIYDESSSVLNSERTMFITGVIKRYAFRVWVELVGDDSLSEQQFIDRSNRRIRELCLNRFGPGILIQPETFFDNVNTTWNTRIHIGANRMKLVNNISLVSYSYEDLLNASI